MCLAWSYYIIERKKTHYIEQADACTQTASLFALTLNIENKSSDIWFDSIIFWFYQ